MDQVIRNVNLVDVEKCVVNSNMDVRIADGKIQKIEKSGKKILPDGKTEIDGLGRYLLPGFINCHVHLGMDASVHPMNKIASSTPVDAVLQAVDSSTRMLHAGFTTVRDCGGLEYEIIKLRNSIYAGLFRGPDIVACGQAILMTGGHFTGAVVDGPYEALKAVRRLLHEGADFVKLMATGGLGKVGEEPGAPELNIEEMKICIDEGKKRNKKSAAHTHGAVGMKNAIAAGIDTLEHCTMLDDEIVAMILKKDIFVVPTFAPYKIMVLLGVESGLASYMVESSKKVNEEKLPRFAKAYKAGVKIAFGTDAGSPLNPHDDIMTEVRAMFEVGVSLEDVLKSLTINAASALGLEKRVGQIKEGYKANLVLLDANPLEDIFAYEKLNQVIIHGTLL